jgi:hypothetical protein
VGGSDPDEVETFAVTTARCPCVAEAGFAETVVVVGTDFAGAFATAIDTLFDVDAASELSPAY